MRFRWTFSGSLFRSHYAALRSGGAAGRQQLLRLAPQADDFLNRPPMDLVQRLLEERCGGALPSYGVVDQVQPHPHSPRSTAAA